MNKKDLMTVEEILGQTPIFTSNDEADKHSLEVDMVNRPPHYCREGAMECIDEMVMIFGVYETAIFCKLNAYKYRYRAGSKGSAEEDMKKSDWYMKKYNKLVNTSENNKRAVEEAYKQLDILRYYNRYDDDFIQDTIRYLSKVLSQIK